MDMSSTQSVSILETFNAQKYRIFKLNFCSYNFHIFRFSGAIWWRGGMSKHSSDHYLRSCHDPLSHHTDSSSCMKFFLQTIWKSLFPAIWHKILHYQQNVPQHNYLLDTLVYSLKVFFTSLLFDKGALMKLFFTPGISTCVKHALSS